MRRWHRAGGALLLLACILCGALLWQNWPRETAESMVQESLKKREAQPSRPMPALPEAEAYESPVDFAALREMNPDIYAWIYIPGTEVSYPVLQREGDNEFYLQRDSTGKRDQKGCIFTESEFNSRDFDDPVTIVYGHRIKNGAMFGSLQDIYSTPEGMEEREEVIIYLPEREIHYQVFAAVPYSSKHILYYHDFSNPSIYQAFLDAALSVRSLIANVNEAVEAGPEDRLLILSTCLSGNNQKRYLILAKETELVL